MFYKYLVSILSAMLIFGGTLDAQLQQGQQQGKVEVSKDEMKRFVKATSDIQAVQKKSSKKMQQMIMDVGMEVKRYQQLSQKKEKPSSDKEKKKFNQAQKKVKKEQQSMNQKMVKILKDYDFKPNRYMKISRAMRNNSDLKKRFQKAQKSIRQ